MKVEEAIDLFLQQLKNSGHTDNTISAYRSDLRQFCAYLCRAFPAVQGWQDVSRAQTAAYRTHLRELGRTSSTIARKNVALSSFFAFGGMGSPAERTTDAIPRPANAQPTRSSLLSSSEIARLFAEPARSTTARRDRALLALLYATGAQASELAGLNLADVDADVRTIVCGAGGKHARQVSLGRRAAEALADYLAEERNSLLTETASPSATEQPLFPNHRGKRLTRQGVWLIVRTYAAAAGIDSPVTPRMLRHLGRANLTDTPVYEPGTSFLLLDGIAVHPEQLNQPANQ